MNQKFSNTQTTLQLNSGNLNIDITSPSKHVLRIKISQKDRRRIENPYSVVALKENSFQCSKDENGKFQITLASFKAAIDLDPFRMAFYTHDGHLINKDSDLGVQIQENGMTVLKELQPEEKFVGLGEKTGPVNRRGWQFKNWNTDAFAYHQEYDPLYSSIPFYIGINDNLPYGIFVNNSSQTDFNFGASNERFSFFRSSDGFIDYFFIYTGDVQGIVSEYLNLTGRPELPPLWALGYQQCRYSYYPQEELMLLAETFRKKRIPCDVLYLDIHYMDSYKVFTWNRDRFPEPKQLVQVLRDKGFHLVIIQDPGIKVEESYHACKRGLEEDIFVKYPDGKPYVGEAWPGRCYFPDFTSQKARDWWISEMTQHLEEGISGFWNDMNEPAVWGKHFPDFTTFEYEGQKVSHLHAHNVYGMQMVRATYEAQKLHRPALRPFCLTRAAFAGSQRYAWKWTGDNISNEEHFFLGQRLINSLSVSGYFFCGNDVGGFIGECAPELFMRWIAVGAFNPFFRGHSMINSRDHEPWSFGEESEEVSRNFITLRYKLIPYLYTVFYKAVNYDEPINRPMYFDYYTDNRSFDLSYGHQFFCGRSILVCPVPVQQSFAKVWLPGKGCYYEMFTGERYEAGEHVVELHRHRIPVYVKGGQALLSMTPSDHLSFDLLQQRFQLHCYKGSEPEAGIFYIDRGEGYDYLNGRFVLIRWNYQPQNEQWTIQQIDGNEPFDLNAVEIYLHGYDDTDRITINNKPVYLENVEWTWIPPVSSFDPYLKQSDQSTIIKIKKGTF